MGSSHLIGQVLDEKYLIEKRLGQGGMGSVYLATHVGTDRPVAVKVITPQFMNHDEFVGRFQREAKAAGRLRHPNVVDVTDFGFADVGRDRVAYLVMEYLDGCSLADVLAEETLLPVDWAVDILDQACSAVAEAHQQGIIHRDLKPDNIWLEPNRRGGYTIKVLDFGLAKLGDSPLAEENGGSNDSPAETASSLVGMKEDLLAASDDGADVFESATLLQSPAVAEEEKTLIMDQAHSEKEIGTRETEAATLIQRASAEEDEKTRLLNRETRNYRTDADTDPTDGLTRVGSILGTPLYMSPEQCSGAALDTRSDIYSLGVIAYRMLSGRTPFEGDLNDVMRHHIETPPPPLRELNRKIPKKVARVVMSALAKNADERPANAAGFASALHANSEGAGAILRRAIALFGEHAPIFLRLSFLVNLPLIVMAVLQVINNMLVARNIMPRVPGLIIAITLALLIVVSTFVTSSIIGGVIVRLVTQLIVVPLRPLRLRPAFAAVKKRLRPLLTTVAKVTGLYFLGFVLLVIPLFIFMYRYTLVIPVLMMEDKKGREAMKRSRSLVRRVRRTAILILIIQFFIPMITSFVVSLFISLIANRMGYKQMRGSDSGISELIRMVLNLFIIPLISIMSSLLYLKARQAGGETLDEAIGQFEEEDVSGSKWQMRMRERIQLKSGGTIGRSSRT